MLLKILLWINISLFILHEMDAVITREWRMMVFMNRLNDNTGYIVFTSLHFFLYLLIFYLMENHFMILFITVSVLLIVHQFMHIVFRKHTENRMNNAFSRFLISAMTLNSCVSIAVYLLN